MQAQTRLNTPHSDAVPVMPKGQCCTRCFQAKTDPKKCRCRCKGMYHGKAHQKTVEELKKELLYDPVPATDEEEEDTCGYTGEPCIGDPLFCEECEVMQEMEVQDEQ